MNFQTTLEKIKASQEFSKLNSPQFHSALFIITPKSKPTAHINFLDNNEITSFSLAENKIKTNKEPAKKTNKELPDPEKIKFDIQELEKTIKEKIKFEKLVAIIQYEKAIQETIWQTTAIKKQDMLITKINAETGAIITQEKCSIFDLLRIKQSQKPQKQKS